MTKQYNIILKDGEPVTVYADSHEIRRSALHLYGPEVDGEKELVGQYANVRGWNTNKEVPKATVGVRGKRA